MCPQPGTQIHSSPSCQEAYIWHTCWVASLSPPYSLSSRRENNSMWQAISFLISCVWSISPRNERAVQWRQSFNICGRYVVLTEGRWTAGIHGCVPQYVCVTEGREGGRGSELGFQHSVFNPGLVLERFLNWILSIYIPSCYHWLPQAVYNWTDGIAIFITFLSILRQSVVSLCKNLTQWKGSLLLCPFPP